MRIVSRTAVLSFTPALGARREQPFGRLTDDHEIDGPRTRIRERDAHAGQHANRPDARVELETIAKVDLRNDLGAVGIAHIGVSHGAEEDGVRGGGSAQCFLWKRDASLPIALGTGLVRFEPQPDVLRPRRHGVEQRQARRHDFTTDPIPRKDGNPELSHHGSLILTAWPAAADA